MKEPARTDGEFRKKLDGLFRELHSIKGEASALNLMSVAHRVHALEDMVSELKKKPELSGNDFLPIVLKLDELLAHLRSVRELGSAALDAAAAARRRAQADALAARHVGGHARAHDAARRRRTSSPRRCSRWPSGSRTTTARASSSR